MSDVPPEVCPQCGFDGADYDLRDAQGTLRAVPWMWRQLGEGLAEDVLLARPGPQVWSAAEYAAHSAEVAAAMAFLLEATQAEGGDVSIPFDAPEPRDPDVTRGFAAAVGWLEQKVELLLDAAQAIGPEDGTGWSAQVRVGDGQLFGDAAWILRHAVHDLTHHVSDAGRGLARLGAGALTQQGTVAHLARSGGGVPKAAVDEVEVDRGGVVGDVQADRRNHGRPFQALCLWSGEVIDALRAEGHTVHPGAAGENITVRGIDWTTIRTGVRLRVGEVLCEVSVFALPCAKNAQWFRDRDFRRMEHDRHPGWSRAYAWVREPGTIRQGDPVVVEP